MLLLLGKLQNRQPPITMPKTKTAPKQYYTGGQLPGQRNGPSPTWHTLQRSEEMFWRREVNGIQNPWHKSIPPATKEPGQDWMG